MFFTHAVQLMVTPGLYWCLVDELHLTIVMTARVMLAQMLENITIEDVVRLFMGGGITIPQISDMFKWGQTALAGWSMGSDAGKRMEAMQAMMTAREQASQENQDQPVPLEPRWWYPPTMC